MRLGFAASGRLRVGLVQNPSELDGFDRIRANSGRLRRFLDHTPDRPRFPPETQTHFGPLNGPPSRGQRSPRGQAVAPRSVRRALRP